MENSILEQQSKQGNIEGNIEVSDLFSNRFQIDYNSGCCDIIEHWIESPFSQISSKNS